MNKIIDWFRSLWCRWFHRRMDNFIQDMEDADFLEPVGPVATTKEEVAALEREVNAAIREEAAATDVVPFTTTDAQDIPPVQWHYRPYYRPEPKEIPMLKKKKSKKPAKPASTRVRDGATGRFISEKRAKRLSSKRVIREQLKKIKIKRLSRSRPSWYWFQRSQR